MKSVNLKVVNFVSLIVLAFLLIGAGYVRAIQDSPITGGRYVFPKTLLSATTTVAGNTNATSTNGTGGYMNIAGAKRVEVFFTHGGVATTSTGTSTMTIQVSPDGINWYDFGRLTQSTSTTFQANTIVGPATGTQMFGVDLRTDGFYAIQCIASYKGAAGASGEQTCTVAAEY